MSEPVVKTIEMTASIELTDWQWELLALFMDGYSNTINTMVKECHKHREKELIELFRSMNEQVASTVQRFKSTREVFETGFLRE